MLEVAGTRRSFRAAKRLVAGGATGHAGASRQPGGRYRAGPGGPRMRAALRASSGSLGTPCGVPLSCLAAPAWRRFLFRADFWLAARIPMGRERSRLEPRGRPAARAPLLTLCRQRSARTSWTSDLPLRVLHPGAGRCHVGNGIHAPSQAAARPNIRPLEAAGISAAPWFSGIGANDPSAMPRPQALALPAYVFGP